MLDKGARCGRCSDCGRRLNAPKPEAEARPSAPLRQRRVPRTDGPSRCASCEKCPPSNGQPHKRVRPEPHSCPLCAKTFISSTHLAVHQASHSSERRYKCGICGKYFHQPSHLMAHKQIHSGDRPFKCPECGKTFGRASHLKTHRRLHTGEKPFKCSYCDKAFAQKAGLMAHVRLHTGERRFKCETCGDAFQTLSSLLSHKAHRAPEPASSGSGSLLSAQGPEANGDPEDLNCGVCCRTFVRSSYIRLYVRIKNGLRPYHCKVCNKTFVKMDTFVNHCDNHLRKKRGKNVEERKIIEKVVKPPSFVPQAASSSPQTAPSLPVSSEVITRSRTRAKSKL